jgi:CheY-like chemotaxis protein
MDFRVQCLRMRFHLLLIDDDPFLLHAFSDMLAFNFPSIQVTAVDSGVAAVAEVEKQNYDIVICDLMMPGMDGAMTLEAIRKDHPSLRMYLMTGHPEPEKAYKATQATGFIKKPLDREQFFAFMRKTILVMSVGKKAMDRVMQANECLSSSMQRQAELARFLEAKFPAFLPTKEVT